MKLLRYSFVGLAIVLGYIAIVASGPTPTPEQDVCIAGEPFTDRFNDIGDGTVCDNLTGLIWLKNANCFGQKTWGDATSSATTLGDPECGLNDGSVANNWRLPTKSELQGIGTDPPTTWDFNPSVTWTRPGAPFTEVQLRYWTNDERTGLGYWTLDMNDGETGSVRAGASGISWWPVK